MITTALYGCAEHRGKDFVLFHWLCVTCNNPWQRWSIICPCQKNPIECDEHIVKKQLITVMNTLLDAQLNHMICQTLWCDEIDLECGTSSRVFWHHILALLMTGKNIKTFYLFKMTRETPELRSDKRKTKNALKTAKKKHRKNCECCPVSLLIVR